MEEPSELDTILKFTRLGKEECKRMEAFIQENIDPKFKLCYSCPSKIRNAHKRIKIYKERNYESK